MERSVEGLCDMIGMGMLFGGKGIGYMGSGEGRVVGVVGEGGGEDDLVVEGMGEDREERLDE